MIGCDFIRKKQNQASPSKWGHTEKQEKDLSHRPKTGQPIKHESTASEWYSPDGCYLDNELDASINALSVGVVYEFESLEMYRLDHLLLDAGACLRCLKMLRLLLHCNNEIPLQCRLGGFDSLHDRTKKSKHTF